MSIIPENVKLLESQRLTDEDDGGGRATGNEVVDGTINNLFADISRLDRTLGDVALRKAFVGISTDNSDVYLGAHAIIIAPPADGNVHVVMFDAGSESDERAEAQNRIESYLVQGGKARFELLGNQYENQRQLVAVQRVEDAIPATGDVFVLKNEDDTQFVRITDVETEEATFTVTQGSGFIDFVRRRMTLSISAPLERTFYGGDAHPTGTTEPNGGFEKTEVFGTEVADASRYWGVTRATDDVTSGDLAVKVGSIYSPLVPSAQTEQPLADQALGYPVRTTRPASSADYTTSISASYVSSVAIAGYLPRPAVRGSVALTIGGSAYTDDGSGVLARSSGSFPFSELSVDYETGLISGSRDSGTGSGTSTGSVTFTPGAVFTGRAETYNYRVTLNNRSYNYVRTYAETKPRPGTMIISYMVLGKWYEIRDPGNGVLEGEGSGSVNFTTGTVSFTLSALPDVGSEIIVAFLMDIEEEVEQHDQTIAAAIPAINLQLEPGVNPTSLSIDYIVGGVTKTVTDDGYGSLTGDGSGSVNYATGEVEIVPEAIHDDGTDVDVSYSAGGNLSTAPGLADPSGVISGTIPNAPLLPGSLSVSATIQRYSNTGRSYQTAIKIRDNGVGGWLDGYAGSIDYSTGVYSLTIERSYTTSREYVTYTYSIQS